MGSFPTFGIRDHSVRIVKVNGLTVVEILKAGKIVALLSDGLTADIRIALSCPNVSHRNCDHAPIQVGPGVSE